jgi:SWI/SNF-related matrix-associated actin-dependent regulator 1 of chromatin subfamily A
VKIDNLEASRLKSFLNGRNCSMGYDGNDFTTVVRTLKDKEVLESFKFLKEKRSMQFAFADRDTAFLFKEFADESAKIAFIRTAIDPPLRMSISDTFLNPALFGHQKEAVRHLGANDRAMLADEMGLGKTASVLETLRVLDIKSNTIIVCPASLRMSWQREARQWHTCAPVVILDAKGVKDITSHLKDSIVIISYETMRKVKTDFDGVLIFDESHRLKNKKSLQAKAGLALSLRASKVWMLSGTPILNRPAELYFPLNILLGKKFNGLFGDWKKFHVDYCDAKMTRFGWDISGSRNLPYLYAALCNEARMLRRLKKDVLDLPPVLRTIIPLPAGKVYSKEKALIEAIEGKEFEEAVKELRSNRAAFDDIAEIRRETGISKVADSISIIKDKFEDGMQEAVIFVHHREVGESLLAAFPEAVVISGGQSMQQRQHAVDAFQSGKAKVIICSIQAAGVGLTLTASSNLFFVEFPWDPGSLLQAEARCNRIGSKRTLNCYYLTAGEGLDGRMLGLILRKAAILNSAIDNNRSGQL